MKKYFSSMPIVFALFTVLSCASTSPEPAAVVEEDPGEFTQEHANAAFEEIYDTHRPNIILEGAQKYTVVKGDTPSRFALKFYGAGNGYYFPLIILASSEVILDPDLIEPGMNFLIPDLQKNLNDKNAKAGVKALLTDIAGVYEKKSSPWAPVTRQELNKLAQSL
jgi:hypothetical protein